MTLQVLPAWNWKVKGFPRTTSKLLFLQKENHLKRGVDVDVVCVCGQRIGHWGSSPELIGFCDLQYAEWNQTLPPWGTSSRRFNWNAVEYALVSSLEWPCYINLILYFDKMKIMYNSLMFYVCYTTSILSCDMSVVRCTTSQRLLVLISYNLFNWRTIWFFSLEWLLWWCV